MSGSHAMLIHRRNDSKKTFTGSGRCRRCTRTCQWTYSGSSTEPIGISVGGCIVKLGRISSKQCLIIEQGAVRRESIDSTLKAYNNSCAEMRSKTRDSYICVIIEMNESTDK